MTDEQNKPLKKGKAKRCNLSNFYTTRQGFPNPPLKPGRRRRTRYKRRKGIGVKILCALSCGFDSGWIIEHIREPDQPRLTKSHIQYWKKIGLDKGIIIKLGRDENDRRKVVNGVGPNYHLLNTVGLQGKLFAPFLCRVHSPGNPIYAPIEYSNTVKAQHVTINHLGEHEHFRLERYHSGALKWSVTFGFLVPKEVIGYEGAYASINYREFTTHEALFISPPEIPLTLDQLEGRVPWIESFPHCLDPTKFDEGHEGDPYRNIVEYILSVFRANGWEFKWWENDQQFHYAFSYKDVKDFDRELLLHAKHYSDKFPEEEGLTIWVDRSHGNWELETSSKWVAIEMMTVLELSRKRFTGERNFPEGWGVSKFKEGSDVQARP